MKRIVALLLSLLLMCGCHMPAEQPSHSADLEGEVAAGQELTCLAQSREEALAIAEQYEIELVTFESGVAVFTTQRSWREVIEQGEENGWPKLSPNYLMELN